MNHALKELFDFFEQENVKFIFDEKYEDTLHFRSYGQRYSVICKDNHTFVFCCRTYPDVKQLIEAINKECRDGDGNLV